MIDSRKSHTSTSPPVAPIPVLLSTSLLCCSLFSQKFPFLLPLLSRFPFLCLVLLPLNITLQGCAENQKNLPPAVSPNPPSASNATSEIPPLAPSTSAAQPSSPAVSSGPWLENPLAELQKNGVDLNQLPLPSGASSPPPTAVAATPTVPESPATEPPPPSPPTASLELDPEILQAAIKRAMTRLRENLQNPTIYGSQYKEVQAHAEELALLVVYLARSPSPPSWARHASALRDLAVDIAQTARDLTPEAHKKAAQTFESIEQLFQGNIPDGIPSDGTLDLPISEFSHRLPLMRRLELAQNQLQSSSPKEADLKKNRDFLVEESAVVGYLMQAMAEPGVTNADEEEYQNYARALISASNSLQTAAREGKLSDFQSALSALRQSCNDCHKDYRFNGEN